MADAPQQSEQPAKSPEQQSAEAALKYGSPEAQSAKAAEKNGSPESLAAGAQQQEPGNRPPSKQQQDNRNDQAQRQGPSAADVRAAQEHIEAQNRRIAELEAKLAGQASGGNAPDAAKASDQHTGDQTAQANNQGAPPPAPASEQQPASSGEGQTHG